MKIAFMTSGTTKSTLSYRALSFARELVKNGHDVYVVSPRFDKYSNFKDEKITQIDGVKIIRPVQLRMFSFELGLISYMVSSTVALYMLNPDIVHVNKATPLSLSSLLPQLIRKFCLIFDADDLDSEVMKIETGSYIKSRLVAISEKLLARQANAITAASKFLQERYLLLYPNKIVAHVPNGAGFIAKYKVSLKSISKNRIVFIGNINRINILKPLFYVVKQLKNKKIQIVVEIIGDGKYLNYFKNLSKKFEIEDRIRFLGWIPQNELYKYLRVGDLGYCYMPDESTIRACSSMKVFQYMQYGSIPIVSNVGDLPYYVGYGKSGYIVKHDDLSGLTEKIIKILKNNKERVNKTKYSQLHSGKMFSWQALTNNVERLYISLLKNKYGKKS